ncbi:MAG: NAD-dependent epimerase/dehydratase family protein, partial [Planctomycetia bacterium]
MRKPRKSTAYVHIPAGTSIDIENEELYGQRTGGSPAFDPRRVSLKKGRPPMNIAIVTGSAGLIGAESSRRLDSEGYQVVGIDNDMRRYFFGAEASTAWSRGHLQATLRNYRHRSVDIRDEKAIDVVFSEFGDDVKLIIHTAAQP